MFGSAILETAIGLLFIYFVLSTISSSLSEGVARLLAWRAKNLKSAVGNMLQNENLVIDFFQNDLIRALGDKARAGLPSYMRSKDFARGILSVIAEKDGQLGPLSVQRIQTIVNSGRPEISMIKNGLSVLISESGMDVQRLSRSVEEWYNAVMERASGWYKRKIATAILVIGSLLTIAANADTIMMLNILYTSTSTRASVVALTEDLGTDSAATDERAALAREAYGVMNQSLLGWSDGPDVLSAAALRAVNTEASMDSTTGAATVGARGAAAIQRVPLGGMVARRPPAYSCASNDGACMQAFAFGWLKKIVGLLLTVAAISVGAPFWFDLLNRVSSLRGDGVRPIAALLAKRVAGLSK